MFTFEWAELESGAERFIKGNKRCSLDTDQSALQVFEVLHAHTVKWNSHKNFLVSTCQESA